MAKKVAIVLNAPELDAEIKEKDVICADGGRRLLRGAFSSVLTVGDFDSLQNRPAEEEIVSCPVIKDYTDGERAVEIAYDRGYDEIVLYGYAGGRSDHVYCNLALLAFANEKGLKAYAVGKNEKVFYYCGKNLPVAVEAKKGDTVSVLPFKDKVIVDESKGLFYPYNSLTLTRTRAVGISNIATEDDPSFVLRQGEVLVFVNKNR